MINFIIDKKVLLTDGKTEFAVTKQIAKFGTIEKRNGDVSISFSVPDVGHNRIVLNRVTELNSTERSHTKKFVGFLEEKGAKLSSGYFKALSFVGGRINLRFYGGNSDWFNKVKTKKLSDLNLSHLNHQYSKASIIDSFDNADGYQYSLFDNGENSGTHTGNKFTFTPDDFVLCIYVKDIVQAIFTDSGLKYSGVLQNDVVFSNMVLPCLAPFTQYSGDEYKIDFGTEKKLLTGTDSGGTVNRIIFDIGEQDGNFDGERLTVPQDLNNLICDYQFILQTGGNTSSWKAHFISYYEDGIGGQTDDFEISIPTGTVITGTDRRVTTISVDWLGQYGGTAPSKDSYIEMTGLSFDGDIGEGTRYIDSVFNGQTSFAKFDLQGASVFKTVDVASVIAEMNQEVLLKNVMFQLGVLAQFNEKTNTVNFSRLNNLKDEKINAPNWTSKIDVSVEPVIDYVKLTSGYGVKTLVKYARDESDLSAEAYRLASPDLPFGDGIIDIDNEFIPEEKALFTSDFASTISRWSFPYDLATPTNSNVIVPHIPFFDADGKSVEPKPRILLSGGNIPKDEILRDGNIEFWLKDFIDVGSGVQINSVGWCYFDKPFISGTAVTSSLNDLKDSLSFDNPVGSSYAESFPLLQKNYSLTENILNQSYHLGLYLKLNPLEIQNLNHEIPIYLQTEKDSGFFYIEEVHQYKGKEKSTLTKLVKI